MNDKIIVSGLAFHCHCGATSAERKIGHRLKATVEVVRPLDSAASKDRLDATVDYTRICSLVLRIGKNARFKLMETLAVKMAEEILTRFDIREVRVKLEKPFPPVEAMTDSFTVEVVRQKKQSPRKKRS